VSYLSGSRERIYNTKENIFWNIVFIFSPNNDGLIREFLELFEDGNTIQEKIFFIYFTAFMNQHIIMDVKYVMTNPEISIF
jgi:hypothetical protein